MNPRSRGLPVRFTLPQRHTPLHRTMPNAEARQRQQTMRNRQKNVKTSVKLGNIRSPRNNYENAFPVNITQWRPEEGNVNIQSRTNTKRAMYNMVNRSRHAALWKKEFEGAAKTRKRTRQHNVKTGGGLDLLHMLVTSPDFKYGSPAQQEHIMRSYVDVLKAKLNSVPEFNALLQLLLMKYGLSPDIDIYNVN